MKLSDKIAFWTDAGDYDLKSAKAMQKTGRYVYTAFLCQQALEKYLKAMYLKKTSKEAPRTHNLVYLAGLIELELTEERLELLTELTSYYIEGRYPDYKHKVSGTVSKGKAAEMLARTRGVVRWLKSSLQ